MTKSEQHVSLMKKLKFRPMKKIIYSIIISSISLVFTGCVEEELLTFSEEGTLTGKVVEANSFEPIENAKVIISPSNNTVFTNEEGYFEFEKISVGDYSVQAEKEGFLAGYEPMTVSADATVNLIFELDLSEALNKPPSTPIILSPEDNAINQEVEVELIWSSAQDVDVDDVLTYGIQIRNDFDQSLIHIESLTDTIYTLNGLQYGVKYFWQVSVDDGYNNQILTPISTFETKSFPQNRYLYVRETAGHNIIYSVGEGGEKIALTSSGDNCWRPRKSQTANRIAFLKTENTNTHIFTMKPDGTDVQQVTAAIPLIAFKQDEIDFSWSSNGDRIIYPSFDKLYLINKDGSGNQLIYQTTNGDFITECDWSYDESKIALKTNDINGYNVAIFTIDINGTVLDTILSGVTGAAGGVNFTVNNESLLYTYDVSGYEDSSYRLLNSHIFIYNFNTSELTDVSEGKEPGTNDLDPRFTPNEAQIIFVNTSNDGISEKQIATVDVNGDDRATLFEDAFMPDWE